MENKNDRKMTFWEIIIVGLCILFLPVILIFVLFMWLCRIIYGKWLGYRVKNEWLKDGKNTLFVYSNSPNWQEYIEAKILPKIADNALVLNWSERSKWDWKKNKSLELKVFKQWTNVNRYSVKDFKRKSRWDGEEYNPIAIVFNPCNKPRVLRFWKAFKDYKHGKENRLRAVEAELFKYCCKV